MNGTHNEIAIRKQRWNSFYDGDRTVPFLFVVRCSDPDDPRPPLWPGKKAERIEWIVRQYHRDVEHGEKLHDDAIPFVDLSTGTEIFAEAFGSAVQREPDQMPYALPFVETAEEADRIVPPELSESPLTLQFEIADEVIARIGGSPVLRLPDIQTPMDIAALIWKKEHYFPAMVTHPESVKRLASKISGLLTEFLDIWFARYGREFVAHYPEYYMPSGITVSEDEIGAVSLTMFEEFFLPELNALSANFGRIGIHCCAHARHQWDGLKQVENLTVLNLNQSEEILSEGIAEFSHLPAYLPIPPIKPVDIAGNARLIHVYHTEDLDEARRISDELNEYRERVSSR